MCAGAEALGGSAGLQVMQSLFGGIASFQQQRQEQTRKQAELEIAKRQWDDDAKRRRIAAIYEIQEAELAQRQANDSSTQSKMEIAREMLRAREEAKAAASAAGVVGNSLNRMLTDISFTEQQKKALVDTNRNNMVNTQQLQKYKVKQAAKKDPLYYTEPSGGNFFSSMLGVVPSLFSLGGTGTFGTSTCGTPAKTSSSCSRIR